MGIFRDINNAISQENQIILTLVDGDTLAGFPIRVVDKRRVKINTIDRIVWIPLDEIENVTQVIPFIR